jgi:hypothetical protein
VAPAMERAVRTAAAYIPIHKSVSQECTRLMFNAGDFASLVLG